jgi:hypothetical protein
MSPHRKPRELSYKPFYGPVSLADLFDVAPHAIQRWIARGQLQGYRHNHKSRGHRRVRIEEIWRFCEQHAHAFDYVIKKLRVAEARQSTLARQSMSTH